ncbi:glycerol-3-phosphate 1-O-acyltransferase PlsY [Phocicoccus pinnipedialis]|uniref:Glycerol-3-phosphate acyltransferase n=1 Tax=Phocicoccus pinnipedialis TaxID=110845 RepID=A0A6V7RE38_9BACL|nr:glycerol-3-phosphate 1-O-acyltransferase PlsY [Jeotgalicoccus pinnipedialis]MBP1939439.1 glycerol-3-phosphate acyltransferase PlsY [Jeotgalicoccus pinnipedialis]CAD2075402.1 Glycerol-3-phosphate acyltransferase [Jeotgalicoccus pinnipedialis]
MLITNIILFAFAYLIGSIPFALLIGKLFYNTDIREHGSGNVGTSNTFRILGKKAGIIVLICDLFKGAIPVWVALLAGSDITVLFFGLVAALGHVCSIFIKFKGGKAVATGGGAILAYAPIVFIILLATFLIILYISKYVSLASVSASIVFLIVSLFTKDIPLIVVAVVLAVVIIVKHISNMKRIKEGTEPKVSFLTKKREAK